MDFQDTDEELILSYKNGDENSLKILIERYTPHIFNFLARLVGRENSSDLVQETFIKVWRNLGRFDENKASFKTWLFTIAKNTSTDFLRKKKSLLFSALDTDEGAQFEDSIEDLTPLPDEAIQKLQDVEFLNSLLKKLPIHYSTVLTLHYQEEMTFDEIGKILDKPLNTVKSQHRRALKILRENLGSE